ncbi:hypothetical protein CDD82_3925 [Ophiocordyceps australis]|uniref:DUF1446 domain-containing protein n=1 Tax=Ophiocordyceps australis TaxID=1399860 RepID=A0A2C5ZT65_9HYPO|nr:hypothetical protein CDD82_3925 [Ophiocordyceps australis]
MSSLASSPPFTAAQRPIRVANCSGANMDNPIHMYNQAKYGPVDVITGDYLAEATLAFDAIKMKNGTGHGWAVNALAGIEMSLEIVNEKRIKIIVNGGSLNPKGLAEEVHQLIAQRGFKLRVAYVDGDNLMPKIKGLMKKEAVLSHLDSSNQNVKLSNDMLTFLDYPDEMPIIAANAYMGYRAIKRGLDEGADIIICGRVADASPVIGSAAWWYGWDEADFDALAGSLVAGHLIECSAYATGGNFSGAYRYPPSAFNNLASAIAEIARDGTCVVTKHESLNGFVTPDTIKCQFLYELQGTIYLNSDVKAETKDIRIVSQGKNRVHVSGIKGHAPPPTTKLAVFYAGGYELEILINACGYATDHKWDIQEAQMRNKLQEWGKLEQLDVLDFQRVGTARENPDSQLSSTTYMRIFVQARDQASAIAVPLAWHAVFMSHFPGMHCTLDWRTQMPREFLGYYPALVPQTELEECVSLLDSSNAAVQHRIKVGPPKRTEALAPRQTYDTSHAVSLGSFGPTTQRPLGDIVLGRSGDKGGNVNLGLTVGSAQEYEWLRSFMTRDRLKELMRRDWRDWYHIERVEMPNIYAVHFVVYGPLGRGVSSSKLLDNLGKGFGEFIRAVWVPIPVQFLPEVSAKL